MPSVGPTKVGLTELNLRLDEIAVRRLDDKPLCRFVTFVVVPLPRPTARNPRRSLGRHDAFFEIAETLPWMQALPRMEAHIFDAGHCSRKRTPRGQRPPVCSAGGQVPMASRVSRCSFGPTRRQCGPVDRRAPSGGSFRSRAKR
jgi:hypothetical protein